MGMSDYYKRLRDKVGHDLLMMPAVAAVIHDEEGRVLMMRHEADGKWSLPAGAIEPGESPTDALVREVAEETGLQVVPTQILGVFGGPQYRVTYPNDDEVEYTVTVFAADTRSGELHAADGEALEFGWFDPFDPPPMGVYYPTEVLAQTRLGPPPNVERIATDFDLPRDAASWGRVPFGICSTCALRFCGHKYREEHGFVDDAVLDTYFRTGELTGEPLERWTAFFILQRGLGGRGLERSPENGRYYRAFYDLFLDLYDTEIPSEYLRENYDQTWTRHYVPKLDDCVSFIRRLRAEMG